MMEAGAMQSDSHPSGRTPAWDYIRTGLGRHGRSLSENNFAKERRDWLAILLREILQNALDARLAKVGPVTVTIQHKVLDGEGQKFMSGLITQEHLSRFKESVPHVHEDHFAGVRSCLIVEDFGTSGLTGRTEDAEVDGRGQNWNAFWFREGEGGKETSSGNGGAGQGKITYFSTSALRTIFAYTIRSDDNRRVVFGASSFLRDYVHDGHKWKRDAYWGIWKGRDVERVVLPVEDPSEISRFTKFLGIRRTDSEAGLSLVIPSPKVFEAAEALQITLAEFYVPILRGDLIVEIGDTRLERDSVESWATRLLTDERARELHTCTTEGYRAFLREAIRRSASAALVPAKLVTSPAEITEAAFDPAQLEEMRVAFDGEDLVSVKFLIPVKLRESSVLQCSFDVHLHAPFSLDRPEQSVIRRDLLVGEEPVGGGKLRQRVRGLVLVADDALSRLLLTAEEATHLRWNTRLPRLAEYYKSGPETVSLVRNAMARLLDVLTGGDQKRDFKLLAKYFSAPGTDSPQRGSGKRSQAKTTVIVKPVVPPPSPRLLTLEALEDGCRVRPARKDALVDARLPITVRAEFAYEGLDRDAFAEYDPLDFDLKEKGFSIKANGCTVSHAEFNVLNFTVETTEFDLRLTGFDKNLRLRMRLTYEEAEHAAALDTE
jgi:hypothetical protein